MIRSIVIEPFTPPALSAGRASHFHWRSWIVSTSLSAAARAFGAGERRAGVLRALAHAEVERVATSIDYVTIADADALVPFGHGADVGTRAVLAIACRIGTTRLIDNVVLGEDPVPALL